MKYSKFFFSSVSKNFLFRIKSSGGRNFLGRLCVFHRGGGNLTHYRFIDIFRRLNAFGYILKNFKDRVRTAFVGLVLNFNGLLSHIILAEGLRPGALVFSGSLAANFSLGLGYAVPITSLPMFSLLYSLELRPFQGAQYARAAGTSALCIAHLAQHSLLKMNSGWQVMVHSKILGSLGRVSNASHKYTHLTKAGQSRWMGFRPVVRGVVKNPCDHPHGGGEGKGSPPAAPRSPWGKLTKGTPSKNTIKDRLLRRRFKSLS